MLMINFGLILNKTFSFILKFFYSLKQYNTIQYYMNSVSFETDSVLYELSFMNTWIWYMNLVSFETDLNLHEFKYN